MRCPVCNEVIGGLSPGHVKKHGFKNIKEFVEKFPESSIGIFGCFQTEPKYPTRSKRMQAILKLNDRKEIFYAKQEAAKEFNKR